MRKILKSPTENIKDKNFKQEHIYSLWGDKMTRHKFKYDKNADCKVCEKCGYVWGEKPSQKCPMKLETRDGKEYYCENCFTEGLTRKQALIDEIGNVFCSHECRAESMKLNRRG